MAVSSGGSNGNGAFSLVAANSAQVLDFLKLLSNIGEEKEVIEHSKEIVELPVDERFEASAQLFSNILGIDTDQQEFDEEDLPLWIKDFGKEEFEELSAQLLKMLIQDLRRGRKQLFKKVLGDPPQVEEYLIVSVLFSDYIDLLNVINEVDPDNVESPEKIMSLYGYLSIHVILIASEEKSEVYPELVEDLSRYPYYSHSFTNGDQPQIPDLEFEKVKAGVLLEAASDLYQEEDISVSRGAELAEVPRDIFEKYLMRNGIRPRYGPENMDELHDDIEL